MAKKDIAVKAAAKPKKKADKKQKNGVLKKITRYFKDLRGEYKKIVWPTKKQIVNNTLVVIAVVIVLGAFVAGLDAVLGLIVRFVLQQA